MQSPPGKMFLKWTLALSGAGLLASCQTPDADPKSLQLAVTKYNARQIEEAEDICTRYIAASPSGERLDEAYYVRGLCRLTRGSRALAAQDLKQALAKTIRIDLKAKAHRALGDIQFESQDWAAAQKDYQAALAAGSLPPPTVTMINYRIGASLQAQGQWAGAKPWFDKVVSAGNDAMLKERAVGRMYATHYSLQFGAFREAPMAREMSAKMQSEGLTAVLDSELREGQLMYLVRSGSYPNWAEAIAARDRLLPKFPLVAIIP